MKQIQTSIRIDKDLYQKVTVKAETEMRNLSNMINYIIKRYLEMEETENGKQDKQNWN